MATCVIECAPGLTKRGIAAASLRPTAIMPTEMQGKPGPSSLSTSFPDDSMAKLRGMKRPATNWTDDDTTAATILSMANRFSSSSISGNSKVPTQVPIKISSSNDPSDVLLHQLSQVCEQAQKTGPSPNKPTIRTVLEADKNSSTLKSTKLANHFISCFVVGGEIRLCAPQMYAIIMKEVHEDDLAHWIRELKIIDHMGSPEQVLSLKQNRAIPPESATCGLMTKTNAERLVGALIDPVNYRILPNDKKEKFDPILIQHDCFGGCEARLFTSLYPGPCVECIQCQCLMTTESFCRHSHIQSSEEEEFCHWGFDAANWTKYIRVHELAERDSESVEKFYQFLKNHSLQQDAPIEEEIELLAKKSMLSVPPITALAAVLAQQQYQQQHPSTSSSSVAAVSSSAPSSLPTASAFQQPMPSSSQASSSGHGVAQPNSNANPLLQLLQQQHQAQQSSQQHQLLLQILNQLQPQQQQAPQPPAASSVGTANNLCLGALLSFVQQQQIGSSVNTLRNAAHQQMNDDSEIPRKRAHTICDPSFAIRPQKPDEAPLSTISFGMIPSDQALISLFSQHLDSEYNQQACELVNVAISERLTPVTEENLRLRKELAEAREEIKAKNTFVAQVAALSIQQRFQNSSQNHFSPTSNFIQASNNMPSAASTSHNQQQPQPRATNDDSDIEVDSPNH